MMMRAALIALTVALLSVANARGADLTIVKDGKSEYAVIAANASPAVKLASEEVVKYLKQMCGAALPVEPNDGQIGAKIFIGTSDQPGIRIRTQGPMVYIHGGSDAEVLNAAYAFLDLLGCRFLAPQYDHYRGAAEVIPRMTDVVLKLDAPIESAPKLAYRKLYVEEGISHDEANLRQMIEWMPKVGYNILVIPTDYQGRGRVKWDNWRAALTPELQKRGLIIEVGGHGYQNFLNAQMDGGKLFAEHPEWFGRDEKGRRTKAHGRVFCTSNADAVRFLIDNFLAYVKQRPEIQIFDFWPPDGARWCTCEQCAKLGEPPERQAILISQVQREVKKVRPDMQLEAIAYSTLIEPPKREKIDPSVLIDFCPIRQNFEFTIDDPQGHKAPSGTTDPDYNRIYFNAIQEWRKRFDGPISIYSYYRRYAWDSLPVALPWHMKREMTWYASIPTQGISSYSEPGDWFAYELNHYVLPALAWDRERDVDALVKKFADARYGAAAPVAISTYKTLADVVRKYCSVPFVSLKPEPEIDAAAQRVSAIAKEVEAARESARDDVIKRHLERLGLVLEYVQRDLAVQKMRAAKAPPEQIRQRIATDHQWISQRADHGVFLVKGHRLNLNRAYRRYGVEEKPATTSPAE